jgi:hypothetical protein
MYVSIYTNMCNRQCLNYGFNKFKVDDLTHVKMNSSKNVKKNSLNHSSIIAKYWMAYVLIYYNKCKRQLVSNDFIILKVNDSTLINWKDVKKSLIHSNINVWFKIVTCVLINYGNYKMQLLSNGFNVLKIDRSTHVPCWWLKKCQKYH